MQKINFLPWGSFILSVFFYEIFSTLLLCDGFLLDQSLPNENSLQSMRDPNICD